MCRIIMSCMLKGWEVQRSKNTSWPGWDSRKSLFLLVKHTGLQQKGPWNNSTSLQSFQTLVCHSQCLKIKRLSHPARKNKSWSQPVISLNSLTNCKELIRMEPKALYLHKPWEHVGTLAIFFWFILWFGYLYGPYPGKPPIRWSIAIPGSVKGTWPFQAGAPKGNTCPRSKGEFTSAGYQSPEAPAQLD